MVDVATNIDIKIGYFRLIMVDNYFIVRFFSIFERYLLKNGLKCMRVIYMLTRIRNRRRLLNYSIL